MRSVRACLLLAWAAGCSGGDDADTEGTTIAAVGPPIAAGAAVGTLAGTHAVTADGAATYALPLEVPPGRAGIQPALSLEYSSRRSGTPLGVGWTLTGTSQIAPCGSSPGRDGELRPVQLAGRDQACLDGVRLLKVAATEYRVEGDTGTRITAVSSDAHGVTAWEVRAKGGRIARYGTTASSRIASGNRRIAWLQSRVEDRSGNYMDFTYDVLSAGAPATELEWALRRIDYAGHVSGTAPTRSVELTYESRPDPAEQYLRGIKIRTTRRLKEIVMKAPSPAAQALPYVRKYVLAYEQGALTGRSRLATVTLCPPLGGCLPPMRFGYADATPTFAKQSLGAANFRDRPVPGSDLGRNVLATDVDGDGRDDLVYRDTGGQPAPGNDRISVRRSTGATLLAPQASAYPSMAGLESLSAYDAGGALSGAPGDGAVDLIGEHDEVYCASGCGTPYEQLATRRKAYVYPSNGQSFGAGSTITQHDPSTGAPAPFHSLADLDGDLRPEVLQIPEPSAGPSSVNGLMAGLLPLQDSPAWRALNRCNGQAICEAVHPELAKVIDIDGDGASDVLLPYVAVQHPNNTGVLRYDLVQVRGTTIEASPTSLETEFAIDFDVDPDGTIHGQRLRPLHANCSAFVDVNGDGLQDLVSVQGGLRLRMNLGTGDFSPWQSALSGFAGLACTDGDQDPGNDPDPGLRAVDYNGDGRGDLLLLADGVSSTGRLLQSTGTGFVRPAISLPFGGVGTTWAAHTLDINGDGLFDLVQVTAANTLELFVQSGGHADLLDRVENGFGAKVWGVAYAALASTGYTSPPASTCGYPVRCVRAPGIVVVNELLPNATSTAASPAGGSSTFSARYHQYAGARADATGWGFLGFATHTVTDLHTGAIERTTYDQRQLTVAGRARYPYAGMPVEAVRWVQAGSVVKATRVVTTYATREATVGAATAFFTYPSRTEVYEYEASSFSPDSPPATPLRKTTTTVEVDEYGNRLSEWTEIANVSLTGVVRNFVNDTSGWLIGLVNQEWFQSWQNGVETRSNIYAYDTGGRVTAIQHDALMPASQQRRTCVVTRDAFGQPTRVDVTPGTACTEAAATRKTVTGYDGDGTFAVSVTNAVGHVSTRRVHPGLGVVYSETDANGVEVTSQYDGFGRLLAVSSPDGRTTTITRGACGSFALCTTTSTSDGSIRIEHADRLGQAVRTTTRSVDDREIYSDAEYDLRGRLKATLRPRYATAPSYYAARYTYDNADRITAVCQHAASLCKRTIYSGLTTDTYDEDDRRQTTRVDAAGHVVASTIYPPTGAATTTYTYGPFGTLTKVTDPLGNVVTMTYDPLGRQTRIDDKDLGWRAMTHDAFGQLATLTDPKGQITQLTYDRLGRLVARAAPDGTDTWTWDTAVCSDTVACTARGLPASRARGGVSTTFKYDRLGRAIHERWSIDGASFDYDVAYDAQGRVDTLKHPVVPGRPRFTLKHVYGPRGHLRQLQDASTATARPLWTLTSTSADEHPMSETLGNGYVTSHAYEAATGRLQRVTTPGVHDVSYVHSPGGNLVSRTDHRNGPGAVARTESFTYDGANRLASATIVGRTPATHTYTYDAIGNVLAASDQPTCTSYVYGGATAGPHRLASAACWGGTAYPHQYDANGNETYTLAPDYREQTWTSFDKVLELGSRHGRMRYTYDAEHRRVKKQRVAGALSSAPTPETPAHNDALSAVWDTTLHAGDRYERRQLSGSSTVEHVFYVRAGGAPIAQLVWREQPASEQWLYFHRDFQGTIERFTDGAGAVAGAAGYDAWGMRRNPDWTSGAGFGFPAGSRLGYTGHAHDDEVAGGVIDMGGRTYDAFFKRFTSPDPIVPGAAYGPSWNRYAYVFNNPLRYTDPSGHLPIGPDASYYSFWGGMFAGSLSSLGHTGSTVRFFLNGDGRARLSNPEPIFRRSPAPTDNSSVRVRFSDGKEAITLRRYVPLVERVAKLWNDRPRFECLSRSPCKLDKNGFVVGLGSRADARFLLGVEPSDVNDQVMDGLTVAGSAAAAWTVADALPRWISFNTARIAGGGVFATAVGGLIAAATGGFAAGELLDGWFDISGRLSATTDGALKERADEWNRDFQNEERFHNFVYTHDRDEFVNYPSSPRPIRVQIAPRESPRTVP